MAGIKILKNKIPFIITLFSCVTVAALAAAVHASGGSAATQTAAAGEDRPVIVLDAGHGAFFLTTAHCFGELQKIQAEEYKNIRSVMGRVFFI